MKKKEKEDGWTAVQHFPPPTPNVFWSPRHLEDVLDMSSRRLQRYNFLSSKTFNFSSSETSCRLLEDVLENEKLS